jgi:hypothetical protein
VTVDGMGHVYVAMSSCEPGLYRYTVATATWDTVSLPGGGTPRGVAADEASLWIGISHESINFGGAAAGRMLQFPPLRHGLHPAVGSAHGPRPGRRGRELRRLGVGHRSGHQLGRAPRPDRTGTWIEHGVGLTPYTYSDFIGFGLNTFAQPRGYYRFTSEGCVHGRDHALARRRAARRGARSGTVGRGLRALCRGPRCARGHDRSSARSRSPTPIRSSTSPPRRGPIPDGRFLEVDVRLRTDDRRVAPRVFEVTIARSCTGIVG